MNSADETSVPVSSVACEAILIGTLLTSNSNKQISPINLTPRLILHYFIGNPLFDITLSFTRRSVIK
jgi:hypothetical protein